VIEKIDKIQRWAVFKYLLLNLIHVET